MVNRDRVGHINGLFNLPISVIYIQVFSRAIIKPTCSTTGNISAEFLIALFDQFCFVPEIFMVATKYCTLFNVLSDIECYAVNRMSRCNITPYYGGILLRYRFYYRTVARAFPRWKIKLALGGVFCA